MLSSQILIYFDTESPGCFEVTCKTHLYSGFCVGWKCEIKVVCACFLAFVFRIWLAIYIDIFIVQHFKVPQK